MKRKAVSREAIVESVARALAPLDCVHAVWEAGAASHGAVDEWSDVDVCVDADDGTAERVFAAVERALRRLSGIETAFPMLFPPEHAYAQRFYRIKGASPFALLDLGVFRHSAEDKFLNPAAHGDPVFLVTRGRPPRPPRWDRRAHVRAMRARLARLRARREIFGCFVDKELERGNSVEALFNYQRVVLDALLEVLSMRYRPQRYGFGVRYVHRELPKAAVKRYEGLAFVRDLADLRRKARAADRWLVEAMDAVDFEEIERRLRS
ncbi:MAG: hypothetical protein FJY74_09360 [Candidatus Eisenbacteria bacterium]|nr:hypothetical protein [Candidatus Eisenbacteria bacterium]